MSTILVVEDNEMNRDILSRELREHGHNVVLAEDGLDGVIKAGEERPDLILMDLSLPGMDGWEATRTIKSKQETRAIPVIALTAHAMPGDRQKALDAGCDDYETKPYDWTRLFTKIDAMLAQHTVLNAESGDSTNELPGSTNESPGSTGIPSPHAPQNASGHTVLIVDDIEANRDLLGRGVREDGHDVLFAADGREALDALENTNIDLVLLDIMMPLVDGYEVLRRMKADMKNRHIPVIVVSASGEVANAVKCIEIGADDYLMKPCDPVLLKARMNACLERKRLRDREREHVEQILAEKTRANRLLKALFPDFVLKDLISDAKYPPRSFHDVAVMFADIVGFTKYCRNRTPEEIVTPLGILVESLEEITARHGLKKIKTIGDSFMTTAGLLDSLENPVLSCINCAVEMLKLSKETIPPYWNLRVGIHSGSVVAGIVGTSQYSFDLWGDTVNTAARIESYGSNDAVNLSIQSWQPVDHLCRGESRSVQTREGILEIIRFKGFQ